MFGTVIGTKFVPTYSKIFIVVLEKKIFASILHELFL